MLYAMDATKGTISQSATLNNCHLKHLTGAKWPAIADAILEGIFKKKTIAFWFELYWRVRDSLKDNKSHLVRVMA